MNKALSRRVALGSLIALALAAVDGCGSDSLVGPPAGVEPLSNQIVFDSDRDDLNREIYAMNLDGTNVRRLTTSPFQDFCPVVSPDGYRIAFYSSRLGGQLALYIMFADGSNPRYVEGPVKSDQCPRWSRSGNRVLFQRAALSGSAAASSVEIVGSDGRLALTAVPTARIAAADPSPDGSQILFARYVENDPSLTGVFVRSTTTDAEIAIDYQGYYFSPVAWSPDGMSVSYLCSALPPPQLNGNPALCLSSPDGTNRRKIDLGISYVDCFGLEWSSDSRTAICPGVNGRIVDLPSASVTAFPFESNVRWFGDNRRIVFASETQFNKRDIFIAGFDGSVATNLTNNPADDLHPSFGPFQ